MLGAPLSLLSSTPSTVTNGTSLLAYSNGYRPNGGHYNKSYTTLLDLVFYTQSKLINKNLLDYC